MSYTYVVNMRGSMRMYHGATYDEDTNTARHRALWKGGGDARGASPPAGRQLITPSTVVTTEEYYYYYYCYTTHLLMVPLMTANELIERRDVLRVPTSPRLAAATTARHDRERIPALGLLPRRSAPVQFAVLRNARRAQNAL